MIIVEGYTDVLALHQAGFSNTVGVMGTSLTEEQLGALARVVGVIEMCLDEADAVWFMLHSGSRGVGNRVGSYFIELAKDDMKKWFVNLPEQDLLLTGVRIEPPRAVLTDQRDGERPILGPDAQHQRSVRLVSQAVHLLVFLDE